MLTLVLMGAVLAAGPPSRTPLVELFTSEGCSSCPPADALLSRLGDGGGAPVVALAYHVTYWDYIGWRDRFADKRFDRRQREYASGDGALGLYTPQWLVDGADAGREVERRIAEAARETAAVEVALEASFDAGSHRLAVRARAARVAGAAPPVEPLELQVAVFERRLETPVGSGENRGRTLRHDWVVRELTEAVAWARPGEALEVAPRFSIPKEWKAQDLGVAAWVRGVRSLRVEQAAAVFLVGASE